MLLVKKCQFFLYLVLVKTRLEIRINNDLDKKETFFDYERKFCLSEKSHFSKRVNPYFWSKNANFFIICFLLK